jgi:phosphatidylserine decarboxylase
MTDASSAQAGGRALLPRTGAGLFIALQHLIPQHALSRVVHRLARIRAVPVKNALIGAFLRGYRPRLDEAAQPDPFAYASFNDFFTRALRPGARPIAAGTDGIASPVDGTVSQIGELDELTLIQAKNRLYQLGALLGAGSDREANAANAAEWTRRLAGGAYATLYLAPYNYHRIHMPLAARLVSAWYVPGRLFSVNATTAAAVTGLFARNERVVCAFETDDRLPFAMVLVGALFVGSIATWWHDDITPCSPRRARELPIPADARLDQGAEMGRFNMGSTVILLFPRDSLRWRSELGPGSRVEVGRVIARLTRA